MNTELLSPSVTEANVTVDTSGNGIGRVLPAKFVV